MTDPQAALRASAEQFLAELRPVEETLNYRAVKLIRDLLAALVGARPPVDLKMRDSVLYAELKDLWSSAHFDPETMPVAIMRDFCRGTREALDAMLKGFEGKSFRQWCDEQWDDGLPQRIEVGARPPAQDEHSVCPDCGNGWTFDFTHKRVYCRTCEAFALVRRLADVYTVDTDQAALIGLVAAAKQLVMPTPASPLPRPEARCQQCDNVRVLLAAMLGYNVMQARGLDAVAMVKAHLEGESPVPAGDAPWPCKASRAEVRTLEARLRAVVEIVRIVDEDVTRGEPCPVCSQSPHMPRCGLDAILRPSATRTQPEKEIQ